MPRAALGGMAVTTLVVLVLTVARSPMWPVVLILGLLALLGCGLLLRRPSWPKPSVRTPAVALVGTLLLVLVAVCVVGLPLD